MAIPTSEDWKKLQQDVEQYGLYHAYRLAIAPTQSISYVQNATSSVMPIVDQIERCNDGKRRGNILPYAILITTNNVVLQISIQY